MIETSFNSEEILLLELTQGNSDAFTAIYNKYWKKLYFLAHKHLKSAPVAEEIVQEVFLALWHKRSEIKIMSLPVYLAAVTRYTVYHYKAKQQKMVNTALEIENERPAKENLELVIDNKLLLEMVEKLSSQLPEKCRLVFIHNKLLDQSIQQVADDLNISTKTAEAHLTKALKVIRTNFGDALSVLLYF